MAKDFFPDEEEEIEEAEKEVLKTMDEVADELKRIQIEFDIRLPDIKARIGRYNKDLFGSDASENQDSWKSKIDLLNEELEEAMISRHPIVHKVAAVISSVKNIQIEYRNAMNFLNTYSLELMNLVDDSLRIAPKVKIEKVEVKEEPKEQPKPKLAITEECKEKIRKIYEECKTLHEFAEWRNPKKSGKTLSEGERDYLKEVNLKRKKFKGISGLDRTFQKESGKVHEKEEEVPKKIYSPVDQTKPPELNPSEQKGIKDSKDKGISDKEPSEEDELDKDTQSEVQ